MIFGSVRLTRMARSRVQGRVRSVGVAVLAAAVGLLALGCGQDAGPGSKLQQVAGQGGGGASGGLMLGGGGGGAGSGGAGGVSAGAAAGGSGVAAGAGSSDPYAPTITLSDGCVPKGPPLEEVAGARLVREAEGINDIDAMGLFDGSLYYAETREGIKRITPATAAGSTATHVSDYANVVWSLLVVGEQLFTVETNSRELWRTPLAALPATPELFNGEADVNETSLLADETNLYFSSWNGGIYALPHAAAPGTAPTQLVPSVNSSQMALAEGHVYYISNSSVLRVPVTGGEPELVVGIGAPRSVVVSDGIGYVVASDSLLKLVPSENLSHTVLATGSKISPTSQYHYELTELKATADRIYFRQEDGSLGWVTKDGSDCRLIVDLSDNGFQNQVYAISETHYYLIVEDTQLFEIPR